MTEEDVRAAYSRRAVEYIDLFGNIESASDVDRTRLVEWVGGLSGRIIDVGCGPGQWTRFLHGAGAYIAGVDVVPEFIDEARRAHDGLEFRLGDARRLDERDSSLGGILAWFSLIHLAPQQLDVALAEFARCVRTGGGLAIGYFVGTELMTFDHAVTLGYSWPPELLAEHVAAAGFDVVDGDVRSASETRDLGRLFAVRSLTNPVMTQWATEDDPVGDRGRPSGRARRAQSADAEAQSAG
ncbi:MAG TPA: class I SAM-dependent methyltransferase [Gordonia sp. (in: high G+C Gram-positive bacteria)]|uniref:class I SAM-dependent methyltransferase n=1 Tax=unclassified Gordonia (in: high G+C Gram-positive bacteria) TaxID=2657482 RepID=UPI0025B8C183|nr:MULTISPECIES: class I SAM-dependent methyltransferase [unclassified Gordonia (in: high G+C Gram-positive bacteria)]HNP56557.1 class I SAM-dependent methyltransferase [Gordonia sp. (in: high G+C Gram-positive bacteria)]HRC49646.1 class I SAM-dependent methyltransferase [Gordonia sp. (in: high G+C Gram-positive bacteria)]